MNFFFYLSIFFFSILFYFSFFYVPLFVPLLPLISEVFAGDKDKEWENPEI